MTRKGANPNKGLSSFLDPETSESRKEPEPVYDEDEPTILSPQNVPDFDNEVTEVSIEVPPLRKLHARATIEVYPVKVRAIQPLTPSKSRPSTVKLHTLHPLNVSQHHPITEVVPMPSPSMDRAALTKGTNKETAIQPQHGAPLAQQENGDLAPEEGIPRNRIVLGGFLLIFLIGGALWYYIYYGSGQESTYNAQVMGHISPVLARVDGYVTEVIVTDNEAVETGQVLAKIEPNTLELEVKQAEAEVKIAQTKLENAQARLSTAEAQVGRTRVERRKASTEESRLKGLIRNGATTREDYDRAFFDLAGARAQHKVSRRGVSEAKAEVEQAKAEVMQRQAALESVQLRLSYTVIYAPITGRVAKSDIEPGQFVRTGQPLMAVVGEEKIWIEANFKESQIAEIHPGQTAEVEVDAYPGRRFIGRVESIAGATGSEFALLPPENASGNFVKVERWIPVRIELIDAEDPSAPLRPGMNVVTTVTTEDEENE